MAKKKTTAWGKRMKAAHKRGETIIKKREVGIELPPIGRNKRKKK